MERRVGRERERFAADMREDEIKHRRVDERKLRRPADCPARPKRALFIEPARQHTPRLDALNPMRKPERVWEFLLDEFPNLLGAESELDHSDFTLSVDPRMGGIARLMARVRALKGSVFARDAEEHLFIEDKILTLSGGRHVDPCVHADGVHGARLDAISAEDAAELVDHKDFGEALVAIARIVRLVFRGLDMDALRRADGAAAEAGDAAGRAIVALRKPVHSAEAIGIFSRLLRVHQRRRLGLILWPERIFDEALKGHRYPRGNGGHIDLRREGAFRLLEHFDSYSHGISLS